MSVMSGIVGYHGLGLALHGEEGRAVDADDAVLQSSDRSITSSNKSTSYICGDGDDVVAGYDIPSSIMGAPVRCERHFGRDDMGLCIVCPPHVRRRTYASLHNDPMLTGLKLQSRSSALGLHWMFRMANTFPSATHGKLILMCAWQATVEVLCQA